MLFVGIRPRNIPRPHQKVDVVLHDVASALAKELQDRHCCKYPSWNDTEWTAPPASVSPPPICFNSMGVAAGAFQSGKHVSLRCLRRKTRPETAGNQVYFPVLSWKGAMHRYTAWRQCSRMPRYLYLNPVSSWMHDEMNIQQTFPRLVATKDAVLLRPLTQQLRRCCFCSWMRGQWTMVAGWSTLETLMFKILSALSCLVVFTQG